MRFSDALRRRRKALGLKQRDVAVQLGVTQQMVSDWESGSLPSAERHPGLAAFLDVEPVELMTMIVEEGIADDDAPIGASSLTDRLDALEARFRLLERAVDRLLAEVEGRAPG
jgi:transcriptional regulator with XRE-family HTH domain